MLQTRYFNNVEQIPFSYDHTLWCGWPDHPEWGQVYDQEGTTIGYLPAGHDKISVSQGEFIPGVYRINPYTVYYEKYKLYEVDWELTWSGYCNMITTTKGQVGGAKLASLRNEAQIRADFGNLGERALLRAESNIAKNVVGMGENLGELAETIRLLRNPFSGIRDFFWNRDYRRIGLLQKLYHYNKVGRWGGVSGKAAAKAAADAWLEFRYGLMPLVYSVQDIIEMVNAKSLPFDPHRIRCAKSRLEDSTRKTIQSGGDPAAGHFWYVADVTVKNDFACNASVQYRLGAPLGTADKLGLTPRFLPELIWELTRLSFVVDWWFEIGPWLGAMRFTPRCEVLGNTVGYRESTQLELKARRYYSDTHVEDSNELLGRYNLEFYHRDVDVVSPSLPQITELNPLDLFRAIDSVSLLYQSISRAIEKATRR